MLSLTLEEAQRTCDYCAIVFPSHDAFADHWHTCPVRIQLGHVPPIRPDHDAITQLEQRLRVLVSPDAAAELVRLLRADLAADARRAELRAAQRAAAAARIRAVTFAAAQQPPVLLERAAGEDA